VEALAALADPTRRELVALLARGELAAGELAERFPVSRPAISRHLRVLREAGLVRSRVEGRRRLYALDPRPAAGARRVAGALPRPVGPAVRRTGHRDGPQPTGPQEWRDAMTQQDALSDAIARRGVVTTEDDGRQRLEFRRSWPDPIDDVWVGAHRARPAARWIGTYDGERAPAAPAPSP
jgi:DNA-binding transcriptional ArsR family regulator